MGWLPGIQPKSVIKIRQLQNKWPKVCHFSRTSLPSTPRIQDLWCTFEDSSIYIYDKVLLHVINKQLFYLSRLIHPYSTIRASVRVSNHDLFDSGMKDYHIIFVLNIRLYVKVISTIYLYVSYADSIPLLVGENWLFSFQLIDLNTRQYKVMASGL
ncbi:hypothetical protein BDC45DRAFT_559175 [Circinella umbellata]|nr:hypothetical protein BDC45DRAFT_559175 [Circinella umbellata]